MLKIDVYNHIFTPRFFEEISKLETTVVGLRKRARNLPVLLDLDKRLRMMEEFGDDYRQVLTMVSPGVEAYGDATQTPDLARIGNDELAGYVDRYDRFVGFVAALPMNAPDAAVAEARRAIDELGASGVQFFTNVNGSALDDPDLLPLFELMAEYDLPIWVHPIRGANMPDYADEARSMYEIWWTFGWPYETSVMMARLVFGGYFDRFPNLKIITHHCGGMTPYFEGRVGPGMDQLGSRTTGEDYTAILEKLEKRPLDYFKMFYGDTAVFGSAAALRCGLEFFGSDHVVFASDSPFDPEKGPGYIRATIKNLDEDLDLTDHDRALIYEGNAMRMMRLRL